jgi:hypothetical protein
MCTEGPGFLDFTGRYTPIRQVNHVSMRPGCVMLDTGCRASVAGTDWHKAMTRAVRDHGYEEGMVSKVKSVFFRFGDGRTVHSTEKRVYPVGVGEIWIYSRFVW